MYCTSVSKNQYNSEINLYKVDDFFKRNKKKHGIKKKISLKTVVLTDGRLLISRWSSSL